MRRRNPLNDGLEHVGNVETRLGGDLHGVRSIDSDDLFDLLLYPIGLGAREIDLVQNRKDLEIVFERKIHVSEGLSLNALRGIDHQDRALTGSQGTRNLISEVDVPGGIDHVQDILLPIPRLVTHAHGLSLDRDSALALDVHGVENLVAHLALRESSRNLDEAVGERAFAVIDMGDDGEISDIPGAHSLSTKALL